MFAATMSLPIPRTERISRPYIRKGSVTFGLIALLVLLATGTAHAQVRFIHMTDPHLFDAGHDRTANFAALREAVARINREQEKWGGYDFVVVTGDLGVEALVEKRGEEASDPAGTDGGSRRASNAEVERRIGKAVQELSDVLAESRVRRWLFVPGNNDLLDEDPAFLGDYRAFLNGLHRELCTRGSDVEVVDFVPVAGDPGRGVLVRRNLVFIGVDNASFKNQGQAARIDTQREAQLSNLRLVQTRIDELPKRPEKKDDFLLYLFLHIPPIDDPYHVSKPSETRTDLHPLSGWLVHEDVWQAWTAVLDDQRIRGVFAGHFHDPRREVYRHFGWLSDLTYHPRAMVRLYVSPPLAAKFQQGAVAPARGFQEIELDERGRIERRFFWLDPGGDHEPLRYVASPPRIGVARERPASGSAFVELADAARWLVWLVVLIILCLLLLVGLVTWWSRRNES